jgi:altronate dehydratase small subunit
LVVTPKYGWVVTPVGSRQFDVFINDAGGGIHSMAAKRALIMNAHDNVATAVEEIGAGEEVIVPTGQSPITLHAAEAIPFGFKIALQEIPQGEIIRKYGETIGTASVSIAKGAMVHIHNLEGTRARGDLEKRGGA